MTKTHVFNTDRINNMIYVSRYASKWPFSNENPQLTVCIPTYTQLSRFPVSMHPTRKVVRVRNVFKRNLISQSVFRRNIRWSGLCWKHGVCSNCTLYKSPYTWQSGNMNCPQCHDSPSKHILTCVQQAYTAVGITRCTNQAVREHELSTVSWFSI